MANVLAELVAEVAAPGFLNPVHAWVHAIEKNTPAKRWWDAQAMHPAIFRALRMDRSEDGAVYAAMPFRLARDGEGNHCILVALPCPRFFEGDDDHLSIDTVLAWYPDRGAVRNLYDDASDQLIGEVAHDEPAHVFADPFSFFRALAEARARWVTRFLLSADQAWRRAPREPRHIPGLLLLGSADKVRWSSHSISGELRCHGIDARAVNRAILRQSNLPRAIPADQMRAAA